MVVGDTAERQNQAIEVHLPFAALRSNQDNWVNWKILIPETYAHKMARTASLSLETENGWTDAKCCRADYAKAEAYLEVYRS